MAMPGNLASWPLCVRGKECPLESVSVCRHVESSNDIPKTRNKSQVEVEDILQPFDGGG